MSRVLVIDDDRALCRSIQLQLEAEGHEVASAHTAAEGLAQAHEGHFDLVLLDLLLPDRNGLDVLRELVTDRADLPVVMVTGTQDTRATIEAMRVGAFDYIRKPISRDDLLLTIAKVSQHAARPARAGETPSADTEPDRPEIIGRDPAILELLKQIGLLARSDVTVLIMGESGTGKELVARALHEAYAPQEPFVAINCSSIVATLPESELFGHEKGAFTGADRRKTGKLEHAAEGVLFLDEVGDLAPQLQAKFLRVLQEREFERVGGLETLPFRARVVSATNRDLEAMAAAGRFRRDLYYRLAVSTLHVPPLRERRGDIPLLVEHLVKRIARAVQQPPPAIDAAAMARLQEHDWPGNIRELQNVLARAVALGRWGRLTADDLELRVDGGTREAVHTGDPPRVPASGQQGEAEEPLLSLREAEKRYVARVLDAAGGNITRAARLLEISPTTLRKKIADYGLQR